MKTEPETRRYDKLPVQVHPTSEAMGAAAAALAEDRIRAALTERGEARVVLATGNSQLTMMAALVEAELDWAHVTLFHMDEYIGIDAQHRRRPVEWLTLRHRRTGGRPRGEGRGTRR